MAPTTTTPESAGSATSTAATRSTLSTEHPSAHHKVSAASSFHSPPQPRFGPTPQSEPSSRSKTDVGGASMQPRQTVPYSNDESPAAPLVHPRPARACGRRQRGWRLVCLRPDGVLCGRRRGGELLRHHAGEVARGQGQNEHPV